MSLNNTQKSALDFIEITSGQLDQRLDNFLIKHLNGVPRTRIYRIIRKGEVRVNKKRCKPDYRLQLGDLVRIPPLRLQPQSALKRSPPKSLLRQLEMRILFENDHLLVIDKPTGVAVHAGSGVDYGVIDALRLLQARTDIELVHRLDRDTSGCLMVAKTRVALLSLHSAMQTNQVTKKYTAIVQGRWPEHLTTITRPLLKYHLANGERRVAVDDRGKSATTRVSLMRASHHYSVIQVDLITGRTHQIRVHCQSEGHAIAGDEKYGDAGFNRFLRTQGIRRLMLHASSVELPSTHYYPEIVIDAKLPQEFEKLLDSPYIIS